MPVYAKRIPVIVGVGQINDRPAEPRDGLDSLGLMEAALKAADQDAGGGWLSVLDSLAAVNQISFPEYDDISASVASRLDIHPRICHTTPLPSGESPILLLNEVANLIGSGEIGCAAVVGGEALRTAAHRPSADRKPAIRNIVKDMSESHAPEYCRQYGLVSPVDVYPLYENACRASYGQTLREGQEETAEIWSLFSRVAAENPGAWMRKTVAADEIATPSANNRPIAFPYTKLMVANSSVNQGAAFIVTSLAEARARGVKESDVIFVGRGAAAHETTDILARDNYHHSASMAVSLQRALALNDVTAEQLDFVELYSCFPCVPKMARRTIGWPQSKPASVVGSLTFGGGPIGNYMSHAVVTMANRLRKRGRFGLLFANGGFATHNHSIILSKTAIAGAAFPQDFDFQKEADAARDSVPTIDEDYVGPATIETYTVFYDREARPRAGVVVAKTPTRCRTLAKIPSEDTAGMEFFTSGAAEPVGVVGTILVASNGDRVWRR